MLDPEIVKYLGEDMAREIVEYNSKFYSPGDARLPKVLIPMIRRTFPEIVSSDIVGVQPKSGPVGLAFSLRYKYDSNKDLDGYDDMFKYIGNDFVDDLEQYRRNNTR